MYFYNFLYGETLPKIQPTGKLGKEADQTLRSPSMQKPGGGKWIVTKLRGLKKSYEWIKVTVLDITVS